MRSAVIEISFVLAAVILGWLKTGWNSLFYIALGLIVFYVIVMVIYIVLKGSTMSWLDKLLGAAAMAGWLAIAWAIIQEKGLNLWGLLYRNGKINMTETIQLETARFILRKIEAGDIETLHSYWSDDVVTEYMTASFKTLDFMHTLNCFCTFLGGTS